MTWDKRPLAECATFMSGGTPNKGNPEFWGGDIPWVSSGEMADQFVSNTSLHLTNAGLLAGSKLVPEGTLFAVVRGMSLATEFRVCYAMRPMAFNQDVKAIIAAPDIEPYFLFSSLRAHSKQIRDLATEAAHGTKKLEMERLLSFHIPVPDRPTQLSAISIAKRYDDLIENNRRRIALLEESARLLYREWFVHLRFPGAGLHSATTGLPDGWRAVSLGDLISLKYGKSLKDSDRIPGDVPVFGSSGIVGSHNKALVDGPAIIVGRKGNVGSVYFAQKDCFPIDTVYFVDGPQATFFNFMLLMSQSFVSSDTAVPGLNRTYAHALPVVQPSEDVLTRFEVIVSGLYQEIGVLVEQNSLLTEARDALLPKLMSGEIAV